MRRTLWILLGVVLTSVAVAALTYTLAGRVSAAQLASPTDDLEWLRLEFRLSETELARIRTLHDGYLPQCEFYCAQIATMKRTLAAELASSSNRVQSAEQQLADIAVVRAKCQGAMLQHFESVSRAMPPAQGQRYLAVMRHITLGQHEAVEASMAECCGTVHGNQP